VKTVTHRLTVPAGRRSTEVASFMAQLDDVHRRLFEDLSGASATELAWQPKRGQNTIGMLLAHMAIVEVYWTLIAVERYTPEEFRRALGIGIDDDGMPLPASNAPPAGLKGRDLAWFAALMRKARAYVRRNTSRFAPADLDRVVSRKSRLRPGRSRANLRWILYHLVEHQAGHHGQILLLRHQYRDRKMS
jgi:uncharacterized damage-inducible protein DinB